MATSGNDAFLADQQTVSDAGKGLAELQSVQDMAKAAEEGVHEATLADDNVAPSRSYQWLHGVVLTMLVTVPRGLTLASLTTLTTDQMGDNAYWFKNVASVVQTLLPVPALAATGYLSQPERQGRRRVLLILSFFV